MTLVPPVAVAPPVAFAPCGSRPASCFGTPGRNGSTGCRRSASCLGAASRNRSTDCSGSTVCLGSTGCCRTAGCLGATCCSRTAGCRRDRPASGGYSTAFRAAITRKLTQSLRSSGPLLVEDRDFALKVARRVQSSWPKAAVGTEFDFWLRSPCLCTTEPQSLRA